MAEVRLASVVEVAELAPHTRWLRLQMRTPSALGFRGGQYVIVDSGLTLPNGKAGKRAYSMLSSDDDQSCIELATLRIDGGVVSNAVHALQPGAELRFSGPWGKLVAPDAASTPGPILVLATDTGVTAALGLLRASRFAVLLANTAFIWLRADTAYFAPEAWVRARLPAGLGSVRIATLPPIGMPERIDIARGHVAETFGRGLPQRAFITGDGAVNYALLDELSARGVAITRDEVESFFNMPKKSS
jgi:ferredoxin-NADP reductase